jgi:hypothetical protein
MSKSPLLTLALIGLGVAPLIAQTPVPLGRAEATLEEPFTLVSSVRELPGGKVIVVDARDKTIQLFDMRSGTATQIGREGSGPGEYQFPRTALAMPNNETFVSDPMQSRFLRIDATGKVLETVAYPAGFGPGVIAAGSDAQGRIYWEGSPLGGGGGGFTFNSNGGDDPIKSSDSVPVFRWDRRSNKIDTLIQVKGPQMKVNLGGSSNQRTVMIRSQPYTARDGWAVAPDGRVAVARTTPYRVDNVTAQGRRQNGTPLTVAPIPVTTRDKDDFLKQTRQAPRMFRTQGGGNTSAPQPPEPKAEDYEWPEHKPFFDAATVRMSPNGELWALRARPAGDETPVYDVFGADGRLLRRVAFPAKTRLVGFGEGTIYTARTDEDDLQYLERYRDCGNGCDSRGVRVGE